MLPEFIVIGAGRSGTTWIHDCLREHPTIFVPESKRLYFFNENYDRGLGHYETFFAEAAQGRYEAVGECCTAYLSEPVCAERIARDLPGVKLVAILRDPVERAFSQYVMFKGPDSPQSFEQAIEERPQLLTIGHYAEHLERFYRLFDRDRVLVLLFDDLRNDPGDLIRRVYRFVGADESFLPGRLNKPSNLIIFPALQRTLRSLRMKWVIELVKKTPLDGYLRRLAQSKKGKSYPKMDPATREKLSAYYRERNERLAELIGRDLSTWS